MPSRGAGKNWETPLRQKVTIVGAGNTGATMATILAARGYADIVLIDIVEGLPQGTALDIAEANYASDLNNNIWQGYFRTIEKLEDYKRNRHNPIGDYLDQFGK